MVLIQLAVTDLMNVIPTSFIGYCLLRRRDLPPPTTMVLVVENMIGWLGNIMPLASIYLVTILSFGRFIAIYRSFDYQMIMSERNTGVMCGIAWLLAGAVACIPYYGGNHYVYDPNVCFMFVSLTKTFPSFSTHALTAVYIIINLVLVIIPALFMIICCMAVIIRLRDDKQIKPSNQSSENSTAYGSNTVLMITVAFILCYGLHFLLSFEFILRRLNYIDKNWMVKAVGLQATVYILIVAHFVCIALNSCINPCIYYLRAKKVREDMAKTIREMGNGVVIRLSKADNVSRRIKESQTTIPRISPRQMYHQRPVSSTIKSRTEKEEEDLHRSGIGGTHQ